MKEIWKDIKDFESYYQISNLGRIRSVTRKAKVKILNNDYRTIKGQLLSPAKTKDGYLKVSLSKEHKRYYFKVHRLVAQTFIPNPNNYPCVNHKDENKSNTGVDNLEWCTIKYNCNYGSRNSKIYNKTSFKKGHIPWNKGKTWFKRNTKK